MQRDTNVLEKAPSYAFEIIDILLRAAVQGTGRISSQQVHFPTDIPFEMNNFRLYIKILPDCKDVAARNTREVIKNYGFHRVLVRRGSAKRAATVHFMGGKHLKCSECSLNFAERCYYILSRGGNDIS